MDQELTVMLSRVQFALALIYHIIFPTINIGLSVIIGFMEWKWLKTGNKEYYNLTRFFTKIFALAFGVGVVSGITMAFMFGTNFANFSRITGNILGPLLSYETLTAFFLEASFLGVMLFGWNRITPKHHWYSTIIVCVGTMISAFWILSANSWMQTPQGFTFDDEGLMQVKSWFEVIFNPSLPFRYPHMITASIIAASLIVCGICAFWQIKSASKESKAGLKIGVSFLALFSSAQILLGDAHGINSFEHQPYKVAAMEGRWETMKGAPFILFGIPDMEQQKNHFEISIPKVTSLVLTHSFDGEVKGLKELPREQQPYVPIVFFSFRAMVGLGFLFALVGLYGWYLSKNEKLFDKTCLLKIMILLSPMGIVATLCGWIVTECGRQPWIVYNVLSVHDGATVMSPAKVSFSLTIFSTIYTLIFISFLVYLFKFISKGIGDYPEVKVSKDQSGVEVVSWLEKDK